MFFQREPRLALTQTQTHKHTYTMHSQLQELRAILAVNAAPPRQLASLFAPFLPLLSLDPAQHAQRTLAAAGGGVSVPAAATAAAAAAASVTSGGEVGAAAAAGGGVVVSGGGPDLVAYGEEVARLLAAAGDIRSSCANDVRTGERLAAGCALMVCASCLLLHARVNAAPAGSNWQSRRRLK